MRITSKKLMYELQDRRLLGNTLPAMTWGQFNDRIIIGPPVIRRPIAGHCVDIDGNTWHQPEERCEHCGYGLPKERYGLRHRNRTGFPWTRPVGSADEFKKYVENLLAEGLMVEDDVVVTDITELDDTRKTLQGEVWHDPARGLVLSHSGMLYQEWTCREEMRQPTGVVDRVGLEALSYIRTFMDPASQDNLEELLRDYPGHVIEISCFKYHLGWQRTNTLFWETRLY